MYRPGGWEEIRATREIGLKAGGIPVRALEDWRDTYEAGADAMLEGLRNSDEPSCEVYTSSLGMKAYGKSYPGKLVFIPEEE